jgi:hypothetical protein
VPTHGSEPRCAWRLEDACRGRGRRQGCSARPRPATWAPPCPRRWGPGGHGARDRASVGAASHALEHGTGMSRSQFNSKWPSLTKFCFKNLNWVTKTLSTKVVDDTSIFNFCKGLIGVSMNRSAGNACQSSGFSQLKILFKWPLTGFLSFKTTKFEMLPIMKSVSLEQTNNFCIGRFR